MPTGLAQDVEQRTVAKPAAEGDPVNAVRIAANTTVDVTSARLPSRRIPIRLSGLRLLLKWVDVSLATILALYFLQAATGRVLTATVYQILPFVMIPLVARWGLHVAGAYRLDLRRRVW